MVKWIFDGILAAFAVLMPKILLGLGLVGVSYAVIKPMFLFIQNKVLAQISSMPPQFAQAFEMLGVNDFVSIVFSAYLLSIGLKFGKSAVTK